MNCCITLALVFSKWYNFDKSDWILSMGRVNSFANCPFMTLSSSVSCLIVKRWILNPVWCRFTIVSTIVSWIVFKFIRTLLAKIDYTLKLLDNIDSWTPFWIVLNPFSKLIRCWLNTLWCLSIAFSTLLMILFSASIIDVLFFYKEAKCFWLLLIWWISFAYCWANSSSKTPNKLRAMLSIGLIRPRLCRTFPVNCWPSNMLL